MRAALTIVPDRAKDVARLDVVVDARGALADLDNRRVIPWWWDPRPLTFNFREAAHAARDVDAAGAALRDRFEKVFVAPRPQAMITSVMEQALTPRAVGAAVARRLRRLCPGMERASVEGAFEQWKPILNLVGS